MEEQIKEEDIKKWNRGSLIFFVLLAATAVLAVPLFLYGHGIGVVLWILLVGVTVYDAVRIEKQKKIHNIQTYREIVAFTQGESGWMRSKRSENLPKGLIRRYCMPLLPDAAPQRSA